MLAAAFQDGNLLVWNDWKNGDSHRPIKLRGTNGIAYQIGFTNDGELLMSTSDDGTARIWQAASLGNQEPWQLRGHSGPIYAAAFSSDGKYLVTGSTDKSAIVWNKRPVLDEDPSVDSSTNKDASHAASGCGTEIILPTDFIEAGCVETPLKHVFVVSPQGKVKEFAKDDHAIPVDEYQGAADADGLKLDPDYLVIIKKSGGSTRWRYFDKFSELVAYAWKNLPQPLVPKARNSTSDR
jgi:WD40 repeat protein